MHLIQLDIFTEEINKKNTKSSYKDFKGLYSTRKAKKSIYKTPSSSLIKQYLNTSSPQYRSS